MPCFSDGYPSNESELSDKLDSATTAACAALKAIEAAGLPIPTASWNFWKQLAREEKDRHELRRAGLSRLSAAERRALGL